MQPASPYAGFHIVVLDSVDSTNEEAVRRARQGAPDATLVWAMQQSAGRGRRHRRWISPLGNLYCSLLLRPRCAPPEAARLGFVAGVALAEAVEGVLPAGKRVGCKWPNDVLVDGRKVAGILLESAASPNGDVEWVVIGIGANVAWHPHRSEVEYPATSLAAEQARPASADALLERLCRRIKGWLRVRSECGFGPVREAWLARAEGIGERITVRLDRETLEGVFADLDASGALVLSGGSEPRLISTGDVFPVRS